ncbi:MAG: MoxR family ATPase [Verrucomicrobia bacterium]|nr:MoxR family ATPase [Verrucomicrobiota bacterium]MBU4247412.1 MoxR family ATPase [Verrucomicrobiota bacterium]MBU4290950.1 MoxR family ATPase [Verrucomicrobiota bacterium]MBU4497795.1 MoxR family ATPase [Verrucomicrobiota bacterium]MCG2681672.1 MoxR family ATPase [Kiritimatiellia bacterium]
MDYGDITKTGNLIQEQSKSVDLLRQEVMKILVGQEHLLDRMLMALITGGHILLEGVPGLAKTTAVKTLAQAVGLKFQRISFTPDLLPADLIGTMIYDPKSGSFSAKKGPVFTNLLLADEINRAPAKVQSALLEAMQEHQVTIGDTTYPLPEPFLVMATQNPIEHEGTYPLPEAQIDRFMLKCKVSYPSKDDERRIMNRFTRKLTAQINVAMTADQITGLRDLLEQVYCDEKVGDYILDLVLATRKPSVYGIAIDHQIEYGASPRATLYLNLVSRANAMLHGRGYATPQDVKEIAYDVLRHRIMLTYEAEAEEVTSEDVITRLLNEIPVP